jgi:hypothetical protein
LDNQLSSRTSADASPLDVALGDTLRVKPPLLQTSVSTEKQPFTGADLKNLAAL